jgi:hypothetical protein
MAFVITPPGIFFLTEPKSAKEFLPPVDENHQSGKETIERCSSSCSPIRAGKP